MKILIGRGSCEIMFDEVDGKFAGKTLSLGGEGNHTDFWISASEGIYWIVPNEVKPNSYIGITVAESERKELLDYVIKEAKKQGYSLYIWGKQ